ncbi:E3 ubiquitin-protein ligase synoviolin B [Agrilus planipennis]|uniref:RING-type E3 ubiquitin transferase n=1 Tax=Agrilus planipennis TaxID=224129 RepID=A0A1W4WWB2_AGRPL|nr:E3 ubiquitin-protein ligase synoviolin B [Agrilus planipennis]
MRSIGISLLSFMLTTVVIANAYYQKKQFYPSVVYITKSNPSMAVIYIQAFVVILMFGKLMNRIFFGQLRTAEFEHLMERAWYAVTETCLAFTVFRDDFNPKFVALFTLLLFLKSFHWLAEDRVDYMERSPVISLLFHLRVLSLLTVLGALDMYFVQHAYLSTITKGASVQLVFGFEYAILATMVVNVAIKYALHTVDLNSEMPWENKAVFLLYTELIMGFIKVILYVLFVIIMVRIYTLPLFAFRPMYYTIRNFKKAFNDVILSRRAIHNMNTLYPDATAEELQNADNVCIICREEMVTASKKLPCNHIFHTACLRSWFQRQQTCPTCRLNILQTNIPTAAPRREERPRVPPQPPNPFAAPNLFANPNLFGRNDNANPFAGMNPFQQILNPNEQNQNAANQAPGQAPGPSAPTGGDQNNAQSGSTSNTQTTPNNTIPPMFPPFPPFPFMPFMIPPPLPPEHLRRLTEDELKRLEGQERENVEARIQCLRNIQIMLDTAILMMQQYSAAASFSTITSQVPPPDRSSAASAEAASRETNAPDTNSASDPGDAAPTTSSNANDPQFSATSSADPENNNVEMSTSASPEGPPEDEVRKRRLQHFQRQLEQQQ